MYAPMHSCCKPCCLPYLFNFSLLYGHVQVESGQLIRQGDRERAATLVLGVLGLDRWVKAHTNTAPKQVFLAASRLQKWLQKRSDAAIAMVRLPPSRSALMCQLGLLLVSVRITSHCARRSDLPVACHYRRGV